MARIVTVDEAVDQIREGMTLMVGGFLAVGAAEHVLDKIVERQIGKLTVIANDAGWPDKGAGKLISAGLVSRLVASYVGSHPRVAEQVQSGAMVVEFVPQGTLAERIRSGGSGIGGFLTKTGVGTLIAEGKETMTVDGQEYLFEKPLHADVAIIGGHTVDQLGNIWYKGTSRNFNPVMALAADTVIVEADHLVEPGTIEPENVVTPSVLVDYLVDGGNL